MNCMISAYYLENQMDKLHCSPESVCNSLFSATKLNAAYFFIIIIYMQIPSMSFFHASLYTLSKKNKTTTKN